MDSYFKIEIEQRRLRYRCRRSLRDGTIFWMEKRSVLLLYNVSARKNIAGLITIFPKTDTMAKNESGIIATSFPNESESFEKIAGLGSIGSHVG